MHLRRLVVTAALGLASAAVSSAPLMAQAPVQKRDGVWGQSYSDLKPEPDVRFGTLPNGMRYAILHNATPTGQASLRLRIGAGSFQETEAQRGLAHFLEHMAFKGSTHVPQGDMIKILQRKGLAFGPDTNAFTSYDQTVYQLDLPETDAQTIDTGLMLMRDTASELLLTQAAMDPERGVVLSEERQRESPAQELRKQTFQFYFQGQLASRRDPIGEPEVLKTAPVSEIRKYYEAYYRPENATLIAVGDFDVDAMEAKIKARFGDWRGKGPAGPAPVLGQAMARGETVRTFVRDGVAQGVSVIWEQPYDNEADTWAQERRHTIENLGLAILNLRLSRLARSDNPPFLSAGVSRGNALRSARFTTLAVMAPTGAWPRALAAAIAEQRRAVQYGVTEAELQRVLANERASMTTLASAQGTRTTRALANQLVDDVNENEVFTSPTQNLEHFEQYVKGLTVADVNATLRDAFSGSGPLVSFVSPTVAEGGEGAVKAVYDAAAAQPVSPPVIEVAKPWPYDSFGPPGRVVSRREIADLGITEVTFANGVRLNIKPTPFRKEQVQISARIGDGLIGAPANHWVPTWLASALISGGTREMSADDIGRTLSGVVATIHFAMGEDGFYMSGAARRQDLPKDLQLMTAFISRPGYRPEPVRQMKQAWAVALPLVDTTPGGVIGRDIGQLLHNGDARWQSIPTAEEVKNVTPADLPALVGPALASGAMEVSIVGDITPDQAIDMVASTFATLPQREEPRPLPAEQRRMKPPAGPGDPLVRFHRGRADQAIALIEWPTQDFYADPHEARVLTVLSQVLQNRLIDRLRLAEGVTYSPSASAQASNDLIGYGLINIAVEMPPDKIPGFYKEVSDILADLRAKPPSTDELQRAKAPLVEQVLKGRQTNGYWMASISHAQSEPRQLEAARTHLSDYQSITAAEVSEAARRFLEPAKGWKMIARADPAATATPASSAAAR